MAIPSYYTLQNGLKIPSIGFGTYHLGEKSEIKPAIKAAIAAGYRHFDAAAVYKNEEVVGEAFAEVFQEGKVKREDIFVTSKLFNDQHRKEHVRPALLKTLKDLKLTYVDLYLVHWPFSTKYTGPDANPATTELDYVPLSETWAALEELVHEGLAKSIGVSNFNVQLTLDLLSYARIKPQVNQIEVHPLLTQAHLIKFLTQHSILVSAYFPLGGHRPGDNKAVIENEVIKKIAEKHKRSSAQVLIRWSLQKGLNPIVKSAKESRVKENIDVFDFELTPAEVDEISALNVNERLNGEKQFPQLPPVFT